jgi:hypothetical protein
MRRSRVGGHGGVVMLAREVVDCGPWEVRAGKMSRLIAVWRTDWSRVRKACLRAVSMGVRSEVMMCSHVAMMRSRDFSSMASRFPAM